MGCPKCKIDPEYHTFTEIGTTEGSVRILYTAPARSKDIICANNYHELLVNLQLHLEVVKHSQWIMIFDCGDMEQKHVPGLSFLREVNTLFQKEYDQSLKAIYILRPNLILYGILKFAKTVLKSDLLKKMHIFDKTKLELFCKFEKVGIKGSPLYWLMEVVKVSAKSPLPLPIFSHV